MLSFKNQLIDVCRTTLPISALILILDIFLLEPTAGEFSLSLICCAMLILGFTLFLYGVDIGIIPMGAALGAELPRHNSIPLIIGVVFTISVVVTIAEPDVSVFSNLVCDIYPSVDFWPLVLSIALGIGVFLVLAAIRIIKDISIRTILTIGYSIVILLMLIAPESFIGIAFDSGGVTTGPMTIPVLLSLGIGICTAVSSSNNMGGFGLIGIASIGPIVALLVYGILLDPAMSTVPIETSDDLIGINYKGLIDQLLECTSDTIMAVGPLYILFVIFQKFFLHYTWRDFKIMSLGILIASVGMVVFLTGVYTGFMPLADRLGRFLVVNDYSIVILVLGITIGFLVVLAEPAVKILSSQVESASNGMLTRKIITSVIAFGVAAFIGTGLYALASGWMNIYCLIPIYIVAIVLLWFMDKDLIGITYDAGGVATGPMSVAIIMTMYAAIAATTPYGSDIGSFGAVSLIASAPIISLSLLGIYIKIMKRRTKANSDKL